MRLKYNPTCRLENSGEALRRAHLSGQHAITDKTDCRWPSRSPDRLCGRHCEIVIERERSRGLAELIAT